MVKCASGEQHSLIWATNRNYSDDESHTFPLNFWGWISTDKQSLPIFGAVFWSQNPAHKIVWEEWPYSVCVFMDCGGSFKTVKIVFTEADKCSKECTSATSQYITLVFYVVLIRMYFIEMQRTRQCPRLTQWICNCAHLVGIILLADRA